MKGKVLAKEAWHLGKGAVEAMAMGQHCMANIMWAGPCCAALLA